MVKTHSKRINIIFRSKFKCIQKQFRKFRSLNQSFPGMYEDKIQECEGNLNNLLEEHNEGFKIRSKVNKLSFDEKPSRFFLNKECHRAKKKVIDKLKIEDGQFVETKKDILYHVREFYKQLFSKETIDQSVVDYFLTGLNVLSKEQSNLCEGLLSNSECYNALSKMKNNKTPGVDGLPKEFYVLNWEIIGDYFVKMAKMFGKKENELD